MAAEWTYSDYITYDPGSSARLTRLRLHIQEVSNKIQQGDFTSEQKSHSYLGLQSYLELLLKEEKETTTTTASASGTRSAFTRLRANR